MWNITRRLLQPHSVPYYRKKRWVTEVGIPTVSDAPEQEEEINWVRRGGLPIQQRNLVVTVPEYAPLHRVLQELFEHGYAQSSQKPNLLEPH